jgi:ribonuclease HII
MIYSSFDLETSLWNTGFKLICGVDEVGRGCFAGPVVAGAAIFSQDCEQIPGIADSKLLSPEQRVELSKKLQQAAVCWSVGVVSVDVINQLGIGRATQMAFVEAVKGLECIPDKILIDAFYINDLDKSNQQPVKNGDKLCSSIAAASIIAKVYRDELMRQLHLEFPHYGFDKHKGYGTKSHQEAIKKHGLSPLHRTSFNLTKFL